MSSTTTNEAAIREAIRAQLSELPLDRIIGQPTTTTVNHLKQQLAKMASAVKTSNWGGSHGHLPLVISDTEFITVTGNATSVTTRQPKPALINPALTNSTTVLVRARLGAEQALAWTEYWKQESVDSVLVERMVKDIIDPEYIEELENDYAGYSNQTIKNIIAHLKTEWCIVTTLEKKKAADAFKHQWDNTVHITKYARELTKQQKLCTDIGVAASDSTKVQTYVESMYASEMFDDREMTTWEESAVQDWTAATTYFTTLYKSKRKYVEEKESRTNGYESANSIAERTRVSSADTSVTGSVNSRKLPTSVITDTQTMVEYTNSLEESLNESKEYTANLADTNAQLLQRLEEQQKAMMEQQEKFMKMILENKVGGDTTGTTPTGNTKTPAGTRIGPRTCGVCKLEKQHHHDKDCFELPANKEKQPAWYIKKKAKE